jgi:hypothetical protein
MNKTVLIAIGVVAAGAAIWGGLQIRQSIVCSGLEEEYLNSASNLKSTVQTQSLMSQLGKPDDSFVTLLKIEEERFLATIAEIHRTCGGTAAGTAIRKGREIML